MIHLKRLWCRLFGHDPALRDDHAADAVSYMLDSYGIRREAFDKKYVVCKRCGRVL